MTRRPRLALLDPLRILASFAVTWHHVRGGMFLGIGFGLFLFLLIMIGLAASSERAEPMGEYVGRKARYLLVPWVRWSVIYTTLYLVLDPLVFGRSPRARFEPAMLFYGARIELWFLPFAFATLACVKAVERPLRRVPAGTVVALAALTAALVTSCAEWGLARGVPVPFDEWLGALAALPLGIALGQTRRMREPARARCALALLASACAVAYLVSPFAGQGEDLVRRYAVAVACACLGFGWSVSPPASVRFLAGRTFGVYLVHPLAAGVLNQAADWSTVPAVVHVGCIWLASIGLVVALGLLPLGWVEIPISRGTPPRALPGTATGKDRDRLRAA